ncbi:MAG: hypothetical protein WCP10_11955 [Desulfuromonadales bacterium]
MFFFARVQQLEAEFARLKRTPLLYVAGMIRSLHYAAMTTLAHHGTTNPEDVHLLEPWLEAWSVRNATKRGERKGFLSFCLS